MLIRFEILLKDEAHPRAEAERAEAREHSSTGATKYRSGISGRGNTKSALTLLMSRIRTNNSHHAITTDDLAVTADLFY